MADDQTNYDPTTYVVPAGATLNSELVRHGLPPIPEKRRWEVQHVSDGFGGSGGGPAGISLHRALDDGWEPFAVSDHRI